MFKITQHKDKKLCKAFGCQNRRAKGRTLCHKHNKRLKKEMNPEAYYYDLLKQNAKRRGKEFNLTLTEFKEICAETGYMELKGKSGKSASLDRIDACKGYEKSNIQVISLAENSKKRFEDEKAPF